MSTFVAINRRPSTPKPDRPVLVISPESATTDRSDLVLDSQLRAARLQLQKRVPPMIADDVLSTGKIINTSTDVNAQDLRARQSQDSVTCTTAFLSEADEASAAVPTCIGQQQHGNHLNKLSVEVNDFAEYVPSMPGNDHDIFDSISEQPARSNVQQPKKRTVIDNISPLQALLLRGRDALSNRKAAFCGLDLASTS